MNTATYNTYREMEVTTATPGKLIVMMYDGAITSLNRTKDSIVLGDQEAKGVFLDKAMAIIGGLMDSVNPDAGEIAVSLQSLYIYFVKRLMEANIGNEIATVDEILGYLKKLREAWQQVSNGG